MNTTHRHSTRVITVAIAMLLTGSGGDLRSQSARPSDAAGITEASIRAHMEFLASDALNGRGSGTRDEWIAATYIGSHMRRWGLEPMGDNGGFVQAIEIVRDEVAAAPVLRAGSTAYTHGKEILVQALGTGRVSGPLFKYTDGATVPAGAVVLMPPPAPPAPPAPGTGGGSGTARVAGPGPGARPPVNPASLIPCGAGLPAPPAAPPAGGRGAGRGGLQTQATANAAVVLAAPTQAVLDRWGVMATRTPTGPARMKAIPAPASAAPRIWRATPDTATYAALAALPDGTMITLDAELKQSSTFTWNAVGRLTGTDPVAKDEVIVLGAHLDHIGARAPAVGVPGAASADLINNGADDDASGTVAVMELAEALSKGPRPKRTLAFGLFGSEESGGYGAGYFVELPVVPLDKIIAQLQFEMIGRADPMVPANTLWLTGCERSNLGVELAKQGAKLVQDPHPEQSFFTRSDNIRFARKGIVAHTVSSFNLHTEYHTPADEISKVDFTHMTTSIRSMLEPVRWLANSSFKPEWAPNGRPR